MQTEDALFLGQMVNRNSSVRVVPIVPGPAGRFSAYFRLDVGPLFQLEGCGLHCVGIYRSSKGNIR